MDERLLTVIVTIQPFDGYGLRGVRDGDYAQLEIFVETSKRRFSVREMFPPSLYISTVDRIIDMAVAKLKAEIRERNRPVATPEGG